MNQQRGRVSGSLQRGMHILFTVADARQPVGLSDLATRAGLDKATTHRLARTLVKLGCLQQNPESRQYQPGLRVLDLGFAFLNSIELTQRTAPHMRALASEFDSSVSLSVLDGADIVYLDRLKSPKLRVSVEVSVGSRLPAHCSSMGKALLAWLPRAERRALMEARPLVALTAHSITDPEELEAELGLICQRGFAINDEETVLGLRSTAAAILGRDGRPVAALNVAVSSEVPVHDLVERIAPRVVEAATNVSAQLGFRAARAGGTQPS